MLKIGEQSKVRQAPRTAARVIGGQAVVVVLDDQQVHTLNGVGSRVWELADGRTSSQIVEAVVAEFEIDHATAMADVQKFLGELSALGAVEIVP